MVNEDGDEVLTVSEIADRWGCGNSTVRRRIEDRSLPAVDLNPDGERRNWRIKLADVLAFEQRGGATQDGET